MPTVQDVVDAIETIAPPFLAMDMDRNRVGLLAGSRDLPVRRVALALDAGLPAVEAARKMKADMLLVHHPRFWNPVARFTSTDTSGRRAAAIVKNGLALYASHTALDIAPGGVNDQLAKAAGLDSPQVLEPTWREKLLKLAVFVPATHTEKMVKALDKAGAGAIGNYSGCTFRSRGTGTFRCGAETKPFQGKPGSWEEADEFRVETVFGELSRDAVLAAMLSVHPYEEPAYDLYSLLGTGKTFGIGRIGELPKPVSVSQLARHLAKTTGSTEVQYSGKGSRKISRVAVWSGAGAPLDLLLANGAEAVVTGELGYHDVEAFDDCGVAAVTLGHGRSEEVVLQPLAERLKKLCKQVDFKVAGKGFISMTNA